MLRKLIFIFLILSLPLLSMSPRRRGRRNRGWRESVAAWIARPAGAFLGEIGGGLIDDMGGAFEENFKNIMEECHNGIRKSGEEFEDGMHNAGEEFNKNFENIKEDFIGGIRLVKTEVVDEFYGLVEKYLNRFMIFGGLVILSTPLAYFGFRTLFNHINRVLQKPKVIISSSRQGWLQWFARLIVGKNKQSISMVFSPNLENRLNRLICATKQINKRIKEGKKEVKYRNVLLYGPPGTGKTMFARKLSFESGMEFIEITGSSLFQKGAGIGAIDELFSWAKNNKGLCLFIDEADSLFINRETVNADSDNYRIVNHFLNYLGQRSNKFMVIMATNHYKNFDEAMHRRIDDMIKMPLPGKGERFEVLKHYRKMVLCTENDEQEYKKSVEKYVVDGKLQEIAYKTKGFSYGDMHGIVNKLKTDSFTTESGLIDTDLIDQVVKEYKEKFEAFKPTDKQDQDKGNDLMD